jgi:hypothetical protein
MKMNGTIPHDVAVLVDLQKNEALIDHEVFWFNP